MNVPLINQNTKSSAARSDPVYYSVVGLQKGRTESDYYVICSKDASGKRVSVSSYYRLIKESYSSYAPIQI